MPVDLRSDTVTRPSPEMYEAMRQATLGDDVLGDDPTVAELERLGAAKTGKDAALFVPSGTMSNQIALAVHCRPGDAILIEEEAHIVYYEVGAPAMFAQVVTWTLRSDRGTMDPDDIARHILKRDLHRPGTRLLCVENTHNRAGGAVIPVAMLNAYREVADRHGIAMHLDGARAFNAAVALGVDIRAITDPFDTVSICLSKGLRSPVGSLLCGPQTLIDEAKFWRKRLGGGMRQSGLLAACGIVSLTQMVDRLAEDHRRARTIAEALAHLPGIHTDPATTETNIVMVNTDRPAEQWQADLHAEGIWCFPVAPHRLRLVFHADITDDHLDQAIAAFQKIASRQ